MPKTTKRYYVGPHDSIEAIVDGDVVELAWGEPVEVSTVLAEAMDQTPDIWSTTNPQTPADLPASDPKDGD